MRKLKMVSKCCFILTCLLFLLLTGVNQKYCKPITRVVLLHEENKSFDLFAQNNLLAKDKVYNDLISFVNALINRDKVLLSKTSLNLSYLDLIEEQRTRYNYLNNEIEIKTLLDQEYSTLLNQKETSNFSFPMELLQSLTKTREYLSLLSQALYYSFLSIIATGWILLIIKVIELIINWRKNND